MILILVLILCFGLTEYMYLVVCKEFDMGAWSGGLEVDSSGTLDGDGLRLWKV